MPGRLGTGRREKVLIVAESARALAQSAHDGGYDPVVVTGYWDADLSDIAVGGVQLPGLGGSIDASVLVAAADRVAPPPVPLVYGAMLERRPQLLRRLARGRQLLGAEADLLTRLLDPLAFAGRLARLGIPHPPVSLDAPDTPEGWLIKTAGAHGGSHIRLATAGARTGPGDYFQRRVEGLAVSVLVAGDGRRAVALGLSEQWASHRTPRPFSFVGVAVPARLAADTAGVISEAAANLAADVGLRGIGSVDCLVAGTDWNVLEINPRPGGVVDAYRLATGRNLFATHVAACRGRLPRRAFAVRRAAASRYVLLSRRMVTPRVDADEWPSWVADRPLPGSAIRRGGPLCTVLATAVDTASARALVERRSRDVVLTMGRLVRREAARSAIGARSSSDAAPASARGAAGP